MHVHRRPDPGYEVQLAGGALAGEGEREEATSPGAVGRSDVGLHRFAEEATERNPEELGHGVVRRRHRPGGVRRHDRQRRCLDHGAHHLARRRLPREELGDLPLLRHQFVVGDGQFLGHDLETPDEVQLVEALFGSMVHESLHSSWHHLLDAVRARTGRASHVHDGT